MPGVQIWAFEQYFRGWHSPRGGSQSRDERLQETADEAVGVLPGHQEVEQRQDK